MILIGRAVWENTVLTFMEEIRKYKFRAKEKHYKQKTFKSLIEPKIGFLTTSNHNKRNKRKQATKIQQQKTKTTKC